MKKKLFMMTAVCAILLYSCKKDNSNLPSGNGNPGGNPGSFSLVKTSTGSAGTTNYNYDAAGRVTKITYANGSRAEYEYPNGFAIKKFYANPNTVNPSVFSSELNSDGLIKKETRSVDPAFWSTRVYDGEKRVSKITTFVNGNTQTEDFFYSNGNLDSIRFTNNGQYSLTIKRTFYTDKLNSLRNEEYGMPYYGKKDKNLLKTEQYFYVDDIPYPVTTFTYELDAMGRVVKRSGSQGNNLEIELFTY